MWTPLSASRWILLLTLGVVMLPSESGANYHTCCMKNQLRDEKVETEDIEMCLVQTSSSPCGLDAYWIKPKDDSFKCIRPEADWLEEVKKQIECRGLFEGAPIFEVLDKDVEEDKEEEEDEEEDEEEEEEEEE